jgi:2'-5' RNA ligase
MRLFVGIEISEPVAANTLALIARLQSRASDLAPGSRITWVTGDRLHITVQFIGHVDDPKAEAIRAALSDPLPITPFDLTVAGVGTFPPRGSPRVIWGGLTAGRDRLIAVGELVARRLSDVGVIAEERPYNPHLTLGRVRDAAGLRAQAIAESVGESHLGTTLVDAITLFESRLSPRGPKYSVVQRVGFDGGL